MASSVAEYLALGIAAVSVLAAAVATRITLARAGRDLESTAADLAIQYKLLQRQLSRMPDRSSQASGSRLSSVELERISDSILDGISQVAIPDGPPRGSDAGRDVMLLVREITHALNTPLAQVELALQHALAKSRSVRSKASLNAALQSIDLSRAVLAVYRDVSSVVSTADQWDIEDVRASILAAKDMFLDSSPEVGTNLKFDLSAPASLDGAFSNYFVLALIMPLLQNAIEGASNESVMTCTITSDKDVRITISNIVDIEPDISKIKTRGETTKSGDHSGLGLSSVQTILSRVSGGQLDIQCESNQFIAVVMLPVPR